MTDIHSKQVRGGESMSDKGADRERGIRSCGNGGFILYQSGGTAHRAVSTFDEAVEWLRGEFAQPEVAPATGMPTDAGELRELLDEACQWLNVIPTYANSRDETNRCVRDLLIRLRAVKLPADLSAKLASGARR